MFNIRNNFEVSHPCCVSSIQKYNDLSSQNTAVFNKWYMEYFVLSTTCFGLYIGRNQVSIKLIIVAKWKHIEKLPPLPTAHHTDCIVS